jgi:putative DNA primase/helicase
MEARHQEEKSSAAAGGRSDANRQSGSSPPIRSRKVVEAGEALIASGLPVLALKPKAKDPLGRHAPHGFKSATTDVTVARSWFVASPDANLGIAPSVGVLVLDVDPRHGGTDTLASLTAKHGTLPETVTAITGATLSGEHYYFTCPAELEIANKKPAPGLDIKGHGDGYLVAPPSIHPDGGSYRWAKGRAPGEIPMARAPRWLLDLVSTQNAKPNGHDRDKDANWAAKLWKEGSPAGQQRTDLTRLVGYYIKQGQPEDVIVESVWMLVSTRFTNFDPQRPWTRDDIGQLVQSIKEADTTRRPRRWKRASEIVSEPIAWLWKGQLAEGKLTIWAGDPGVAKSAISVDIAAGISRGRPFPEEPAGTRHEPRNVLILSFEDGAEDTIKPRLRAADADMERVAIFPLEFAPSVTQEVPVILDALRELEPALVIIDPLSSGMTGGVDSHKNTAVREALQPLIAALKMTRTAGLVIEHLNKNEKGDRALYRLNGSVAFGAMARFVSIAGPDPLRKEDRHAHVLAPTKENLCASRGALRYSTSSTDLPATDVEPALQDIVKVQWDGTSEATAEDLLTRPRSSQSRKMVDEATEVLRETLKKGPQKVSDLENVRVGYGISPWAWRAARERLGATIKRHGFGQGSYITWELPPEVDWDAVMAAGTTRAA